MFARITGMFGTKIILINDQNLIPAYSNLSCEQTKSPNKGEPILLFVYGYREPMGNK